MRMEHSSKASARPSISNQSSGAPASNDASGITLLLADNAKFGFSERACYHFDLIETLTQKPEECVLSSLSQDTYISQSSQSVHSQSDIGGEPNAERKDGEAFNNIDSDGKKKKSPFPRTEPVSCGIVSLLECIPQTPIRQPKKRKRLLKRIKEFNREAEDARKKHADKKEDYCHQPTKLPLNLNFNTRVAFAYELTRMVFCIDASPTLTSTFGNVGYIDESVCAMDRLEKMVRMFFRGLIKPVTGAVVKKRSHNSEQADSKSSPWWNPSITVTVIAVFPPSMTRENEVALSVLVTDFFVTDLTSADQLSDKIVDWATIEVENEIAARLGRLGGRLDCSSSSLRDIIEKCDAALSTMPSEGRPVIVLASDCRAVQCDSVLDLVRDRNLKDTPLNVLDLSGSHSHRSGVCDIHEGPNYLTFDADGPSSFPLIIPDDSLHLHNACKSTRGYFLDAERLQEAVSTIAGNVSATSSFHHDVYFSVKRRVVRPNALQWHTIFSLSPCCPIFNSFWGTMPPPTYIHKRHNMISKPAASGKTMFFSYFLNPIRAKGILVMRIMDGYRPRRYGTNSQDDDKVSTQFVLKLELGTVLHYEFSYVASRFHNPLVGSAHVKISLSGDPSFVLKVKNEYISNKFSAKRSRPMTLKEKACRRICQFLNWIRQEDLIESRICPLDWEHKLDDGSEFLADLSRLEQYQLYRHFRIEKFEIICTGGDALNFLLGSAGSTCTLDVEKRLVDVVSSWSTRTILHGKLYFRQLPNSDGNLTNYCLVELTPSELPRVFSIQLHYFEQINPNERLLCKKSLQSAIAASEIFRTLPKPLSKRVLMNATRIKNIDFEYRISNKKGSYLQQSESWELLHEPELLPLVAKRRSYFDDFHALVLDDKTTILVKFVVGENNRLYLVQYHLTMLADKALARIYMDMEQGLLQHSFFATKPEPILFKEIYTEVKERDHKCARALRSRRNLLTIFEEYSPSAGFLAINHTDDVQRLLLYASKSSRKLRFFGNSFEKANGILEELTINFILSGTLDAQVAEIFVGEAQTIENMDPGRWFLIRYDSDMLSMAYLPLTQTVEFASNDEENMAYREMCFYTATFADLYYYKVDSENESEKNDRNGVLHLSKFFGELEAAHKHHFSTAAYRALRLAENEGKLTASDFREVMTSCNEEEVVDSIQILAPIRRQQNFEEDSKLASLMSKMLSPVPGGMHYLYFTGSEESAITSFTNDSLHGEDIDMSDSGENFGKNNDTPFDVEEAVPDTNGPAVYEFVPPLFILLTIDGVPATLSDISAIDEVASLSVFLTVFDSVLSGKKSLLHQAVTSMIISSLNSFIAEQTLEQILHEGKQINEVDVEAVKVCLTEAENVASVTIPLHFYRPNTDTMIDASAIASKEGLQSCFFLLGSCLMKQNVLPLAEASSGEYFAKDMLSMGWCWIDVPEAVGPVLVYAFHHDGIAAAERVAKEALEVVKDECRRVNQILLLETMQKSRAASDFLIAPDTTALNNKEAIGDTYQDESIRFALDLPSGYFQCNISHEAFYELNRRCSPSKALLDLEYSVLNSFAVSNRRGVFVYKDEEENIFYMKFEPREGREMLSDYGIAFFVYGIYPAGESITKQLDRLIKKKLMTLCVETISMDLTKSQHFDLPQPDVDFVKSFEDTWRILNNDHFPAAEEEFYEFPITAYDPILVLLIFRQNMLGSTFFNLWQKHDHSASRAENAHNTSERKSDDYSDRSGAKFIFNHRDFSLCYNATQFQLNPGYQAISTLTSKGKEFSRKAGSGIALIEIRLLDRNLAHVCDATVGSIPGQEFDSLKLLDSLHFRRLSDDDEMRTGRHCLSIRIFNTTLEVEPIYRWIELTLNQVLIGWFTERHLERARMGMCRLPIGTLEDNRTLESHALSIDVLCPGCPSLGGILSVCEQLPHPAIKKINLNWTAKATELAALTLDCLERGILSSLYGSKRIDSSDVIGLTTLRVQKGKTPGLVRMKQLDSTTAQVINNDNKMIFDSPTESPQYMAVYGLSRDTEKVRRNDIDESTQSKGAPPLSSFLFQKVFIDDYLSDVIPGSLSNALKLVIMKKPYSFMRRIAFILTVNRYGVSALFYNVNPHTIDIIASKIEEITTNVEKRHCDMYKKHQMRHFKHLGVPVKTEVSLISSTNPRSNRRSLSNTDRARQASIPEERASSPPSKEQKQKRSILIPTIVGNSVKGSAQQALMRSRQRARANTKRAIPSKPNSQRTRESSSSKSAHTSSQQDKIAKLQEPRNYLPPSIQKEMIYLQAFFANKKLRLSQTVGISQTMFVSWLTNSAGKEMSFLAMETILHYATAMNATMFPLVASAVVNPIPFILYFAKNAFPDTSKNITLSKNFVWNKNKVTGDLDNPSLYVMQKLMSSKHFDAFLIHEISVKHLKGIGKIGTCRSWVYTSQKDARNVKAWAKGISIRATSAYRKKHDLLRREKESLKLLKASQFAILFLQPKLKMFMFTLNILRGIAKGLGPNTFTSQLLRETISTYPNVIQQRNSIGYWYRFLNRHVLWDKDTVDGHTFENVLRYILSKPRTYDIVNCTKEEICISGTVPCNFKDAHFFIHANLRQHDDFISFGLFVLCCTRGTTLERYIFEDDSPFALKLSEQLLNIAEETFFDLCETASADMKRDSIWGKYAAVFKPNNKRGCPTICSLDELKDLQSLSFVSELSDLDPRLMEIMNLQELELEVPDLVNIIIADDRFHHYYLFQCQDDKKTTYLVYMNSLNVFVMLELDENNVLATCRLIGRCGTKIDTEPLRTSFTEIVELLGTLILAWIWENA